MYQHYELGSESEYNKVIMKRSLRKLERRIHQSSYHKYIFLEARRAYNKFIHKNLISMSKN